MDERQTLYDAVGGLDFFEALVDRFYDGVAADRVLLRVYPPSEDFVPARRHLAMFLAEYWGGPPLYNRERGHPRLRLRHVDFVIGPVERDRWRHHMGEAVAAMDPPADVAEALLGYFDMAAEALRNAD